MPVELSPTVVRARLPAISWPAVFAAMAVGIALQLLLTLAGLAIGVYVLDTGDEAETITLAAASWGAGSMVVSALVGGYVAGRCSGLRRRGDGALHGVVSWAATTLLYTALAGTAVGSLTTGLFGLLGSGMADGAAQTSVGAAIDRERAVQALTDLGVSAERARSVLDQITGNAASPSNETAARQAGDVVGSATLWLSVAVLISLLLGVLGGMMGVRGSRRIVRRDRDSVAPRPRILSRTGSAS
ncbi:MAG: hypothetical protein ACM3SS_02815 [Rhodospirillaceae bacterium]